MQQLDVSSHQQYRHQLDCRVLLLLGPSCGICHLLSVTTKQCCSSINYKDICLVTKHHVAPLRHFLWWWRCLWVLRHLYLINWKFKTDRAWYESFSMCRVVTARSSLWRASSSEPLALSHDCPASNSAHVLPSATSADWQVESKFCFTVAKSRSSKLDKALSDTNNTWTWHKQTCDVLVVN